MPAELYLCLNLEGTPEALDAMADETLFSAKGAGDIIALEQVQGDGWSRTWAAFRGPDARERAIAYAKQHHTIVTIPLGLGETVAVEEMP